ncbi:MAG: putative zinc-binding metallopeptidase [Alphaproteobacteria bacterium]
MRLFECQHCGQLVYFENTHCERCGHSLGFRVEDMALHALTPAGNDLWRPVADPDRTYRYCGNAAHAACNWLVPAESTDGESALCVACSLNRTIPDLGDPENLQRWQRIETAKRRLVFSLLRLGLPIVPKIQDPEGGLAFDFLAGDASQGGTGVLTGHSEGLITLNVAEADDAWREKHRLDMGEPYRTLLGHFRHEVGHYYWDVLIRRRSHIGPYRALFGDERADYDAALEAHYRDGPPADWPQHFVSAYAAAHPWEDWAETWAHYLHVMDTLETAAAFNLRVRPEAGTDPELSTRFDFDPYDGRPFDDLVAAWLPLTYAVNSLNRSMGQPDLYPFVLPPAVIGKLRFVHDLVIEAR